MAFTELTGVRERLVEAFEARFGDRPTHVVRAPGRVNLMGDHTDYNLLPVLPMAIQREAMLAFRPREDGEVHVHNLDAEFGDASFEIRPGISPSEAGSWVNYLKAPADELARRFAIWRGFDAVMVSTVPVAAGLSSSSAMVNAMGLALARVNEVVMEPLEMAELMADAERYTGTRGGGMDQAISLGAREGCASKIDFAPLRMRHSMIPEGWHFVVADTGVRAEKSGPVQAAYNHRRQECEDALDLVSAAVEEERMLIRRPQTYPALVQGLGFEGALDVGERVLDAHFLRRYRHVLTEARRVEQAVDLLLSADLDGFGLLMDASHGSLHGDFSASSSELDELVAIAREGGAVGARLTGAGWGGCAVALATPGVVDGVIETLTREYYEARGLTDRLDERLFIAIPSGGASIDAV